MQSYQNYLQGDLKTEKEEIELIPVTEIAESNNGKNFSYLRLPVDLYTFENKDDSLEEIEVDIVEEDLATIVKTTCDKVTLCADDACDLNSAIINANEGEIYSVNLVSSRIG